MLSTFTKCTALLTALALVACSQTPRQSNPEANFYAPSTMIIQTASADPAAPGINPYQVLASSDADYYFYPRAEKAVYGSTVLGESSAYTIYTYDQQPISSIWGPSYRYRWIVQTGVTTSPTTP
jgi:hypothetical protein